MTREQAISLIKTTFEDHFNEENFKRFIVEIFKDNYQKIDKDFYGNYIPEAYREFVQSYKRLLKYEYNKERIDVLIVKLERGISVERARSKQRNFVRDYLMGNFGSDKFKDAALVAFYTDGYEDWRFSFVKFELSFNKEKNKIEFEKIPAKRYSFLVGKNEKSHTAQKQLLPLLESTEEITVEKLEKAFEIETVTKEFFEYYRGLLIRIKLELDEIIKKDEKIKNEFISKNIDTVNFAKKLIGQIIFLYFLQKKGWFGVGRDDRWGDGPKNFLRRLFNKEYFDYKNFFNDILEPLFYEALRVDRSYNDHYYDKFRCRIPFLNGGLFDPINNYDWVHTDILLPDELFSNSSRTREGDIGNGILDIFDRYNFTINEEEPLEKEVALDPELLGKIYEKLNAIRADNFDEYVKVLSSGKKGNETKFNKEYGVYYTPREIVHYMCQESLINYFETELQGKVKKEEIEEFVRYADLILEYERTALEKKEKIEKGEQKDTKYEHKIAQSIIQNAEFIDKLLNDIKVCDPAVGSGAFPIGMMHEIVKLRQLLSIYLKKETNTYTLKRNCIENSLYGVDIDPGAVEICKLRFWLSMIVDEEDFYNIKPLPNLDYKVVCGDSLLGFPENWGSDIEKEIEDLMNRYFTETHPERKLELKQQIDEKIKWRLEQSEKNFGYKINFDFKLFFPKVFHQKGGFDIVIANPPYISTKGIDEKYKEQLEKFFGFTDDAYNHFFFRGIQLIRENGILTYITSKTYWTIQTKKNLREILLKNTILQIFDTANPFENAMVDTGVVIAKKATPQSAHQVVFLDGKTSIEQPQKYSIPQNDYATAPNKVIFIPTDFNKKIYERLGKKVNELLNQWWNKIDTSKNIEKHKKELEVYRNSLKPGDITLLGLITEGGQGLATANNGKYIGVLKGTKWAENVRKQRPEKLLLATEFCQKQGIRNKADAQAFLDKKNEKEIRKLFDTIKEKYGRDIFGQGWLYRIVSPDEIANVDTLTNDEKINGIAGEKTFVPYDKGDKDGNRWYAPTPYYIDWSRENVKILQTDSKARWQGYQFYFREGFCWSDIHTVLLKCRIKTKGIHDVKSMSLFSLMTAIPDWYFVCLINSTFISEYDFYFVNNTQTFQINDARQLPIIIPTTEQLMVFEDIFNRAVSVQKEKFAGKLSEQDAEAKLADIQRELDERVLNLYNL